MKLSASDLEDMLRRAPQPRAPAGLKETLYAGINLSPMKSPDPRLSAFQRAWWTRWWPSLATGGLTALCLVVLGVQQTQIGQLRRSIQQLQQQIDSTSNPSSRAEIMRRPGIPPPLPELNTRTEIDRLRQEARDLAKEVNELAFLQTENEQLHNHPPLQPAIDVQEFEEIKKARAQAQNIMCINNMKQLGLAVRIWNTHHNDAFPPDVSSLVNEITNPTILVCPDDPARKPAVNWQQWTPANLSYLYLGGSENDPNRVMFRCPIHGNITLCDGSVISTSEQGPPPLLQKDGKLYFESRRLKSPDGN